MTHARQQIREGLVTLAGGLTSTGDRVYDSRAFELTQSVFPFWAVFTTEEEAERVDMSGKDQITLELVFMGCVRELNGLAAQQKLDLMIEELQTALSVAAVKAAIPGVRGWAYRGAEFELVTDDTDQLLGFVELTYSALYFVNDGAPGAFA